jgi:hypothetical protein
MTGMQLDLEAIVREVMRRLERELSADKPAVPAVDDAPASLLPPKQVAGGERDPRRPATPEAPKQVAGAERDSRRPATPEAPKWVAGAERDSRRPATLEFADRVVTWARLKDRLSGIKRLVVPPGAVLTPSVRDELRKRSIQLQVASGTSQSAGAGNANLLIAAAAGPYDAEAAIRTIAAEAGGAEQIGTASMVDTIGQLRGRIEGLAAVLVTSEPAAAACLANRYNELRAVWAADVATVSLACQSIGANLLILNPVRSNANELRSMVRQFLQGSHRCPADWQAVLAESRPQ